MACTSPLALTPRTPASRQPNHQTAPTVALSSTHALLTTLDIMGNSSSAPTSAPAPIAQDDAKKVTGGLKVGLKSGKKICCCCPDTKQPRDACILAKGEEDDECQRLIELHKECLRGEGFTVK